MNKKGVAFIFLIELIVLASFVSLMFVGASKIISNEGKYRAFNTENLGLFIERIPSIDNNFYYEFKFVKGNGTMNLSVVFTDDKIMLDSPGAIDKKYLYEYQVPRKFRLNANFESVNTLYFYKYGDTLEVLDYKDDSKLDLMSKFSSINNSILRSKGLTGNYLDYLCGVLADDEINYVIKSNVDADSIVFSKGAADYVERKYNSLTESFSGASDNLNVKLILEDNFNEVLMGSRSFIKSNDCEVSDLSSLNLVVVQSNNPRILGAFS